MSEAERLAAVKEKVRAITNFDSFITGQFKFEKKSFSNLQSDLGGGGGGRVELQLKAAAIETAQCRECNVVFIVLCSRNLTT